MRMRWPVVASALILSGALAVCGRQDEPGGPTGPTANVPPLSALELFPDKTVAIVGEQIDFTVTARDTSGNAVLNLIPAFSISTPAIVAADRPGRFDARSPGVATLTATAGGKSAQAIVYVGAASYDYDALGPPLVMEANYIDLAKVQRISRFRSAIGHSYTDGSETCRSMKHYFQPRGPGVDWTGVDIYSPVEGSVFLVRPDGSHGMQMLIRPRALPFMMIALFHVNLDPGIVRGTWLAEGQHIGRHASGQTMSDIAVSLGPKEGGRLISFFEAMTPTVFAEYAERGVPSRAAAVITRAERDADPVPCVGEHQFSSPGRLPNWIDLN